MSWNDAIKNLNPREFDKLLNKKLFSQKITNDDVIRLLTAYKLYENRKRVELKSNINQVFNGGER